MKLKINWTIVFWISIIILFMWLVANALELFDTPLIIEIMLYIAGFAALLAVIKRIAEYAYKVDTVVLTVKEISRDLHKLDTRVSMLETTTTSIDRRVGVLESRI